MMKRLSFAAVFVVSGAFLGTAVTRSFLHGQPTAAPAVPREMSSFRGVVKQVLPAVVSIESRGKPARAPRAGLPGWPGPLDPRIPEEFRRFFEDPQPQQFREVPGRDTPQRLGIGSGFLVDPRGIILTNNHVVDGADEVIVQLSDGRKLTSKDVKTDPKTDLALVRIEAKGKLPFLRLGDSSKMEIGDRVLAVGAPFGLVGSVTHGIISGKDRSLRMNMYEDFVQTDAAINPGNSGGPLVNLAGEVIGINAAIKTRNGGFQGVGLAVSSNLARDVMKQLLANGSVKRGYLGVQIKDVDDAVLAKRLGLQTGEQGVLVTRTFEDAPAAKGGVKEGDVITAINGNPIKDGRDLQWIVARLPLNKPVTVRLVRDGQPRTVQVTVVEQPADLSTTGMSVPRVPERVREPEGIRIDKLGIEAGDLSADLAERLGYRSGVKGAVVLHVRRGSPAVAELAPGMVISKLDKTPVDSAEALRSAVAKASLEKGVILQVRSPRRGANYILLKSDSARGE
jgi:serine protease Do